MSYDLVVPAAEPTEEAELVPALWVCRIRFRAYGPDHEEAPQCMSGSTQLSPKHEKAGCGYYRFVTE